MEATATAFDLLLSAEIGAARLEGLLRADAVLAAQWRAEAAVAEAVASIGLEDVRLAEGDLLARIADSRTQGVDAPAVEDALAVLRFLRAPGDPLADPVGVLERIDRLARRDQPAEEGLSAEDLRPVFAGCIGRAPLLEALRASAFYGALTLRRSPVAERMVFVAADHAARRIGPGRAGSSTSGDPLRGLGGRVAADWIALPSLALTRGRFSIWSPGSGEGARRIVEGLRAGFEFELGKVIGIRSWQERLRAAGQDRHGRSRLADAGKAFGLEPVMTARVLAARIGVTPRGALNLLGELEGQGLVREITLRRAARIWATPGLAEKLAGARSARSQPRPRIDGGKPALAPEAVARDLGPRPLREEGQEGVRRALAEFDRVLSEVDGILAKRPE
ncbi:hypothetical protein C5F48_14255 [Cereibacter changlensis JA139]|uniref:HTH DNA binding domain-containing protein n=2 Tax=Cereibacter changlensis TaxID=402884 RepID=A0A2T4JTA6_9RHOB|nr:hypothetical protein [Cereibacter changlensis]PTE21057.1 hypothetical protein C5F48_14255 [Cereibacter changlensis JA139]PZX56260.1 hypothetical protein LX76_01289 [Cereibacter changlensis]